jgi:asparagine synthetase B (glutamine-hydrolysing)
VHSVRTADRTLFDGIYAVPPGAALLARDGRVKIRPYWDTDFPAAAELATDPRSGQSRANLL